MTHPLILGHLTVLDLPPPEVVRVAAETGFGQIGLRLLASRAGATSYPIAEDPEMMDATLAEMTRTGVSVFDVDVLQVRGDTDVAALEPFFTSASRLGARSVLVTAGTSDRAQLVEKLSEIAAALVPHGMVADLEYMAFTPTVPDLDTAIEVAQEVGADNLGVLVDTIHWDRLGADAEAVRRIPRQFLHYVHFTDARAERPDTMDGLREDTRRFRMMPGEGGLDLVALVQALPDGLPLCVEVSNEGLNRTLGARARAERAMASTRAVLERAGRAPTMEQGIKA